MKLYAIRDPSLPVGEVGQVVGILQRHAVPLLVESNPGPGKLEQPINKLALLPLLNKQGKGLKATDQSERMSSPPPAVPRLDALESSVVDQHRFNAIQIRIRLWIPIQIRIRIWILPNPTFTHDEKY
jgi:hypothetical protein